MPKAKKLFSLLDPGIVLLGAVLLKSVYFTLRSKKPRIVDTPEMHAALNSPCIFIFWHGRQLMVPPLVPPAMSSYQHRRYYTLISMHRDGRLIARIVKLLGLDSVAGSSTRGGRQALSEMVELIKEGAHVAITPDGPKGPIYKMKAGAIKLAQLTGAPIIAVGVSSNRKWQFGSWDAMQFPKPFSRLRAELGLPIYVPAELNEEEFAQYLQQTEMALNKVTETADQDVI